MREKEKTKSLVGEEEKIVMGSTCKGNIRWAGQEAGEGVSPEGKISPWDSLLRSGLTCVLK